MDELQSRKKEILSVWKREKERERPDTLSSAAPCSPVRETSAVTLAMSDRKREINKQKLAKWQRDKEEEKTQKEVINVAYLCGHCDLSYSDIFHALISLCI